MSEARSGYDDVSVDFLVLIGRIVIGWGHIERAIDLALVTRRSLIPKHFDKGLPRALGRAGSKTASAPTQTE
jgi:hypothetical protein